MKLELRNLKKEYGDVVALDSISMEFEEGIYGILGVNGAGKSTMINLITDNVKREGGEILYEGEDILKLGKKFRALVGYMPQEQGFYEEFSPRMFLRYMANLKGIPSKKARIEIEELLEILNLKKVGNKRIGDFSGGMKQRVVLGQALLGDPRVLILDEPTAGLDPKERVNLREYIAKMAKDRIILYCTHVVSDIESIADKIIIMSEGTVVKIGTPQELKLEYKDLFDNESPNLEDVFLYYIGEGKRNSKS